jgi:hypothetical protein
MTGVSCTGHPLPEALLSRPSLEREHTRDRTHKRSVSEHPLGVKTLATRTSSSTQVSSYPTPSALALKAIKEAVVLLLLSAVKLLAPAGPRNLGLARLPLAGYSLTCNLNVALERTETSSCSERLTKIHLILLTSPNLGLPLLHGELHQLVGLLLALLLLAASRRAPSGPNTGLTGLDPAPVHPTPLRPL